jgi:hypothetical protein
MEYLLPSPVVLMTFWTGSFPIVGWEEEDHSLAPSFSRFDSSGGHCLSWKVKNVNELRDRIHQSCRLHYQCLPVPIQKLNIVFMCFVSLMVPTLRYIKQTRSFVRSTVWKFIDFRLKKYNVSFYRHLRPRHLHYDCGIGNVILQGLEPVF